MNDDNSSSPVTFIVNGPIVDNYRQEEFFILLPSIMYTAFLMTVGMPGNLIVIFVYLMKMAKTTSRHFIISLAICDFINCGFGMPVELSLLVNFYNFDYPILCKVSRFCTFFMNNVSSLILVGIAVDRFRRVCMPLKPNLTVTHSKILCIVFVIVSMISALPGFYIYGTKTINIPLNNTTKIQLKTCHVDDEVPVMVPLVFSLYLFICIILMFGAMTVMYALIARVVCSRKHFGDTSAKHSIKYPNTVTLDTKSRFSTRLLRSFSERSPNLLRAGPTTPRSNSPLPDVAEPLARPDRTNSDLSVRRHGGKDIRAGRTTMILFVVTLVFVLSFVPFLVIVTIRYISPEILTNLPPIEKSIYNFTLRSYLLNSAVNPVIYCFLNRNFRLKVKRLFRSLLCCFHK